MGTIFGVLIFLLLFGLLLRPRIQELLVHKALSPLTPIYMLVCPKGKIGEVRCATERIRVQVAGAGVSVVRQGEGSQIVVQAKYPGNWQLEGDTIMQTRESGDHLLKTEKGRFKLVSLLGTVKEELADSRVSIADDHVFIDAKQVRLIFEDDELEVIVPTNYKGGIEIHSTGSGNISLGDWSGGDVVFISDGSGDLSCGELTGVASLKVALNATGDVQVSKIDARGAIAIDIGGRNFAAEDITAGSTIDVHMDNGDFTAGDVRTPEGTFSLTSTGTGDVQLGDLTADSAHLEFVGNNKNSNLTGKKFSVGKLEIETCGTGDINLDEIAGSRCQISISSNANVNVPTIDVDTFKFTTTSTGDLTATDLTAHEGCSIDLQPKSNCNVTVETIESASTVLQSEGQGSFDIETISGGSCAITLASSGDLDVDEFKLDGRFECTQSDNGDAVIGTLKAQTVSCESSKTGGLTISNLDATEAVFAATGTRTITVEDGSAKVIKLKAVGDGDITVSGSYDSIHTEKSGNGTISIS